MAVILDRAGEAEIEQFDANSRTYVRGSPYVGLAIRAGSLPARCWPASRRDESARAGERGQALGDLAADVQHFIDGQGGLAAQAIFQGLASRNSIARKATGPLRRPGES